jgi:2-polyprenyl-6-methoxyphenol hydroxylase-like FAD-dependent oxidoreductase
MAAIPSSQTEVSGRVSGGEPVHQYDAIVVGAGFSGIANLYRLRKDGLKVHVFEQGMNAVPVPSSPTFLCIPHQSLQRFKEVDVQELEPSLLHLHYLILLHLYKTS